MNLILPELVPHDVNLIMNSMCQGFFAECFLSNFGISDFDRFLPTKKMSWIVVDGKVAELFLQW